MQPRKTRWKMYTAVVNRYGVLNQKVQNNLNGTSKKRKQENMDEKIVNTLNILRNNEINKNINFELNSQE